MQTPTDDEAKQIYQDLLDRIAQAYFENDFAYYVSIIGLPHRFTTGEKTHILETSEELHSSFNSFREYMIGIGITNFVRVCSDAFATPNGELIGTHTTHMIANGIRQGGPYLVQSALEWRNDRWVVIASNNALLETDWQARTLTLGVHKKPAFRNPAEPFLAPYLEKSIPPGIPLPKAGDAHEGN